MGDFIPHDCDLLAGLRPHPSGEPPSQNRQDTPGRGQNPPDRQPVRHPPSFGTRNLQMFLVQGTMLYAAELTWSGQKGVEGEHQRTINCMARSTLGASRPTPQGILAAKSKLAPARALLDHRQAKLAQRLLARPQDGGGLEEILARDGAAITRRLRVAAGARPGEAVEPQAWSEDRAFPGGVCTDSAGPALEVARNWPEEPSGPTVQGSTAVRRGRRALGTGGARVGPVGTSTWVPTRRYSTPRLSPYTKL